MRLEGVHELHIDMGKGYRVYFGNAGGEELLKGVQEPWLKMQLNILTLKKIFFRT